MLARIRTRLHRADAANLHYVSFAVGFSAAFAFLAALWQIGLSAQMHFAPSCSPDDAVRLSCTYTAKATVSSVSPDFIFIQGVNFQTNQAELPLWADVSFLRPGDVVSATEWKGHIVSLTRSGRTLAAMGNPDAGPVAWPGVLVFCAIFGAASFALWRLGNRTRVTITRNFWGRAAGIRRGSGGPS
jgi:hypothetical protein